MIDKILNQNKQSWDIMADSWFGTTTEFSADYYSPYKAKKFPLSFIIKARKL